MMYIKTYLLLTGLGIFLTLILMASTILMIGINQAWEFHNEQKEATQDWARPNWRRIRQENPKTRATNLTRTKKRDFVPYPAKAIFL